MTGNFQTNAIDLIGLRSTLSALSQKHRKDMEAIRRVLALLEIYSSGVTTDGIKSSILDAVKDVVSEMPSGTKFSVQEIADALREGVGDFFDREAVSAALWRLWKRGELIHREQKGEGKRPPVYVRHEAVA